MRYVSKAIYSFKNRGFFYTLKIILKVLYAKLNLVRHVGIFLRSKKIKKLLRSFQDEQLIIFYHISGWGKGLKQRPHHIASELAKRNFTYIYPCESFFLDAWPKPFLKKIDGVSIVASLFPFLRNESYRNKPIVHLWSTNYAMTTDVVERFIKKFHVLYEYVDEVDEAITGPLQASYLDSHKMLLKNPDVPVICTASKLYEDAELVRGSATNVHMASNGVFLQDFDVEQADLANTHQNFQSLVQNGTKVLGYYGAFASWIDFELLEKIALRFPSLALVLIGNDYDGSLRSSDLGKLKNVQIYDPIPYKNLKDYGCFFDVGLVPFKINEVTESTSPVKLFEYMAMGIPIVSTDIRECRRYESVLVGKSEEETMQAIETALSFKNEPSYQELLAKEAMENTWEKKVDVVEKAIRRTL